MKVNLKAYVFVPIGVPGATSGSMFTPVPVEITAYEPEVIGLDLLHKTKVTLKEFYSAVQINLFESYVH